jgi:hypothetical protein
LIVDRSNEIEFIGSYFRETDISSLKRFEQSIIGRILSATKPVIKSEDSLYETVWRFVENVADKTQPSEDKPFK